MNGSTHGWGKIKHYKIDQRPTTPVASMQYANSIKKIV